MDNFLNISLTLLTPFHKSPLHLKISTHLCQNFPLNPSPSRQASVAIRLQPSDTGQYICVPCKPRSPLCYGCPLSGIQVALPVLVSSQFCLTPDRRHLTSTIPPSSPGPMTRSNVTQSPNLPSWNEIMFSDPVSLFISS